MKPKRIAVVTAAVFIGIAAISAVGCGNAPNNNNGETNTDNVPYNAFYDAEKWEYMTNDRGASLDVGEVPVSLDDGSIRFYRANQAYELGYNSNGTISFMLKATHNFSIWLNSSSKDNTDNSSYRLESYDGELQLRISTSPYTAAAIIKSNYEPGKWNRFEISFATSDGMTDIEISVNDKTATLTPANALPGVSVAGNVLTHIKPSGFNPGKYFAVKVWYADDYVQLKPIESKDLPDVPIVAAIGDSITEGAGATNFYTESYPAQLQTMLGGKYNVINFGMSGRTARTDLSSYDANPIGWIQNKQFLGVKAIVPDIAIVKLGSNDSKFSNRPATTANNFKTAYEKIIKELLVINPSMTVYVCTSATAYGTAYDISNENIENIIIPTQLEVAEEYDCYVIDIHEYTKNKSQLFPDTIHPSTRGYTMLAEIFAEAINNGTKGLTDSFIADIDSRYNDRA